MSDFWSKKFGSQGNNHPASPPAYAPQLPAMHNYAPPVPQGNPKAPSSFSTTSCPQCGSGNYTGSPSDATKMIRCYDCGYNPRFGQQSGAGGLPAGQSAPASAARQVSTTGNYQPQVIIGRIGA